MYFPFLSMCVILFVISYSNSVQSHTHRFYKNTHDAWREPLVIHTIFACHFNRLTFVTDWEKLHLIFLEFSTYTIHTHFPCHFQVASSRINSIHNTFDCTINFPRSKRIFSTHQILFHHLIQIMCWIKTLYSIQDEFGKLYTTW